MISKHLRHSVSLLLAEIITISVIAGGAVAQGATELARLNLDKARDLIAAQQFAAAEQLYTDVLNSLPATEQALRGAAYFGRGFSAQKRSASVALTRARVDSIAADYRQAALLDAEKLQAVASYNLGFLLRDADRQLDALEAFRAAARSAHPQRALFLFETGRQFARVGRTDSAVVFYDLAAASGNDDALDQLFATLVRSAPASSLFGAINRHGLSPANAEAVIDALVALLMRLAPVVQPAEADTALVLLARGLVAARIGPPAFQSDLDRPLDHASRMRATLSEPIRSLRDAYDARSGAYRPLDGGGTRWWANSDRLDRRAAWSGVMRSLGDWYNQSGNDVTAESYYENAIGRGGSDLTRNWADPQAALPLALIYMRRGNTDAADRLEDQVDRLTTRLVAPPAAGGREASITALERVNDYYMTLGAVHAARAEQNERDAQKAELNLERMRRVSDTLERRRPSPDGKSSSRPPPYDLLEWLAIRQKQTGKTAQAAAVESTIVRDLRKRGREAAAESTTVRIKNRAQSPPPTGRQPPPRSLRAIVTDARTGRAIPNASVSIGGRPGVLTTDPKGAFTADLSPGSSRLAVTVSALGYDTVRVTVDRDKAEPIKLPWQPWTGTVVDAVSGAAISHARVEARVRGDPTSTQTDARGVFRLEVPPGFDAVRLTVLADGYRPFNNEVDRSSAGRVLLTRGAVRASSPLAHGTVVDTMTHRPVAGARVAVRNEDGSQAATETGPSGEFTIALRSSQDVVEVLVSARAYRAKRQRLSVARADTIFLLRSR